MSQDRILTVSELHSEVNTVLSMQFPSAIQVSGEVSNAVVSHAGHQYFTLKDDKSAVRCVMFRGICQYYQAVQDGDEIVLLAQMGIYAPQGQFQLQVMSYQPLGLGALQKKFEQLKKALTLAGWFDPEHKKPLPAYPRALAVVTSLQAAALADVLSVLERRFPLIPVEIYPCQVQGLKSVQSIVQAINQANQRGSCDVILLVRGGGSIEDLWSYNEEAVVSAIFHSKLPIVTGIGHESDVTLSDFAADVRAATPSVAAESVVPMWQEVMTALQHHREQMLQRMLRLLGQYSHQIALVTKQLLHNVLPTQHYATRTADARHHLCHAWQQHAQQRQYRFSQQQTALQAMTPRHRLQQACLRWQSVVSHGQQVMQQWMLRQVHACDRAEVEISLRSPKQQLQRGFVMIEDIAGKQRFRRGEDLQQQQKIRLCFSDRVVHATIDTDPEHS